LPPGIIRTTFGDPVPSPVLKTSRGNPQAAQGIQRFEPKIFGEHAAPEEIRDFTPSHEGYLTIMDRMTRPALNLGQAYKRKANAAFPQSGQNPETQMGEPPI